LTTYEPSSYILIEWFNQNKVGEPMPRTEAANQHLREMQREKILVAARSVFAHKGVTATMADIATEAEVSHGLAYHYFANKEVLFQALVEQTLQERRAALQRFREIPMPPGERLDFLMTRLVENRRDHPEVAQLHEQVQSSEATPPDLREQAKRVGQVFADLLRQLIVEGQAADSVIAADPDQLVTAVLAVLDGLTRLAVSNPERFRQHFPDASIILGMLKPPARSCKARREQTK
jgi:AcrR family transcriptional regulator